MDSTEEEWNKRRDDLVRDIVAYAAYAEAARGANQPARSVPVVHYNVACMGLACAEGQTNNVNIIGVRYICEVCEYSMCGICYLYHDETHPLLMHKVPAGPPPAEEDRTYQVDRLVGRRKHNSGWQYLVRWQGYSRHEDTWEPEGELFLDDIQAYDLQFPRDPNRNFRARERRRSSSPAPPPAPLPPSSYGRQRRPPNRAGVCAPIFFLLPSLNRLSVCVCVCVRVCVCACV